MLSFRGDIQRLEHSPSPSSGHLFFYQRLDGISTTIVNVYSTVSDESFCQTMAKHFIFDILLLLSPRETEMAGSPVMNHR